MKPKRYKARGFALIVTLTLMILLTVISVGLLTLSSISLRSSGQGESMATARSNARLALMLALGELQKTAGPDQRVTAPGNLVNVNSSPAVTGVWESWKPSSNGSNDHAARKVTLKSNDQADGEFVTWLASTDPSAKLDPKLPPGSGAPGASDVTLVSERKLDPQTTLRGTILPPVKVNQKGAMAWTVMDEGVKARVDLPTEVTPADVGLKRARLRAPGRPQAEAISAATEGLKADAAGAAKLVSLAQAELRTGKRDELRPYMHDLTPYSASLPINVADGGLKADLTRAFEETNLPNDLKGRYVYSNGKTAAAVADPLFSTLASYYQLYKKSVNPLQISTPASYAPSKIPAGSTIPTPLLAPLNGTLVAPVVTRVSVVFSLVSRVGHGDWAAKIASTTGDSTRRNMVYLIYTPVVTAYNPYSVPIQFRDLKVSFRNLPVAFKFFRGSQAQTVNPTLLNTFHILSENDTKWEDKFSCTVSNTAGSAAGSTITLYPGEARVFGESHPETATFGAMTNFVWQASQGSRDEQTKTKNVYSGAGWDYRSGYIVDWLRPAMGVRTADNKDMGVFGVRPTDTVNVEVSPISPGASNGKFTVDFSAKISGRDVPIGVYEYNYGTQQRLTEVLQNGNHSTLGKISFPFKRERDFTVSELTLSNPDSTPLKNWSSPKQFAIFTLGTRTASESLYPGKPGKTSSFVHHVLQMDATKSHPALLPMEMSLLPITGTGAGTVGSIDADDVDRAFYFSGTTRGTGSIHYVAQNVPTTPLVNLADFRHANLASSGHLPLVQHTVGESQASAVIPGDKARAMNNSFGYEVVDHAWFANQTLWDGYFFSGVRNQSDASLLFDNQPLPLNPREVSMPTPGLTAKAAAEKAISPTAWADLASMLAIKGGFNVNSVSKSAWKATLTSLRGYDVPVLGPILVKDPSVNPASYREVIRTATNTPFPRLSRPIGEGVSAANISDNQRRWSGFRELDDAEIDKLADAIVTEVRTRGPFLSMAEFVNRRLTSGSDDMAARGALEQAILASGINTFPALPGARVITETEASGFGYANPKAAAGSTEEGASAVLSQGDLLSAIGASITVRSDTFVIRAYGAARDGTRVKASAWCEAVIQRTPSFVDASQAPETVQTASSDAGRAVTDLNPVNTRFGRRFEVVSFRWLNSNEI